MAVNVSELHDRFKNLVRDTEALIDKRIREKLPEITNPYNYIVISHRDINWQVLVALKQKYKDAGWTNVESSTSGDYIYFYYDVTGILNAALSEATKVQSPTEVIADTRKLKV